MYVDIVLVLRAARALGDVCGHCSCSPCSLISRGCLWILFLFSVQPELSGMSVDIVLVIPAA